VVWSSRNNSFIAQPRRRTSRTRQAQALERDWTRARTKMTSHRRKRRKQRQRKQQLLKVRVREDRCQVRWVKMTNRGAAEDQIKRGMRKRRPSRGSVWDRFFFMLESRVQWYNTNVAALSLTRAHEN